MEPQQNQPPILPIEEIKPPHNHKILWILLSVFILLLISGIFVFTYVYNWEEKSMNNIQPIATTTDEFAGWKTYRNEEYGFEFKYPTSFATSSYEYGTVFKSERRGDIYVGVKNVKFDPNNIIGNYGRVYDADLVNINDKIGYKYPDGDVCSHETVKTDIENNTLSITFVACEEQGEIPFTNKEVDQILSTFKFIEKSDNTLVKIYNHGGLCAVGEECSSTVKIGLDGKIEENGKLKKVISQIDLNKLSSVVNKANYESMLSTKFTGTCPIAYDGVQVEYTFYTDRGKFIIDSCKVQIDEYWELFVELNTILRKYIF